MKKHKHRSSPQAHSSDVARGPQSVRLLGPFHALRLRLTRREGLDPTFPMRFLLQGLPGSRTRPR
jgi:hypothetical protein